MDRPRVSGGKKTNRRQSHRERGSEGEEEGLKPERPGDEEKGSRVGRGIYTQGFQAMHTATTIMKICCLIIKQLITEYIR